MLNDQRQVIFSQRNEIIDNKSVNYAENFLDEVVLDLIGEKRKYIANPRGNIIKTKFSTIFGKLFNEKEIDEILKKTDDEFSEKIKNEFSSKKETRVNLLGEMQNKELEKRIFLQIIDQNWKNHIQYLEQLRQVIGLRSYGNRDPLIEYKKEAYILFEDLLLRLKTDLIKILFNLAVVENQDEANKINFKKNNIDKKMQGKKIGRNEMCFCGSKKKYKHCCGSL